MMEWRLALPLLACLFTAPAFARKPPLCPPAHDELFLSPMGEPFRAPPGAAYPAAAWFAQADADHDGRLTPAEMAADADRFFARLDTDHDGEIIPDEVTIYERDIAPEIRLYTPGRTHGRPTREEERATRERIKHPDRYGDPLGAGRWSFLNLPEPVTAADDDLNRGVTREEFRKAARDRFAQIDTAHAGALTLAALPKTPMQTAATDCTPVDPNAPPPHERRRERP